MQDYLTRFKHIDAVWAADDDMMVGVLKAIDQAKRTDIKEVSGGAGSKEAVKRIYGWRQAREGRRVVLAEVHLRRDQADRRSSPEGRQAAADDVIPSVLITRENAKQFYFPNSPF